VTFSPGFVLTAACCRWPASEARTTAIRAAAADIADWDEFFRQVKRHRVIGLVQEALSEDVLSSAGIQLPPAVAQALAAQARRIALLNLNYAAETARLQRAFADAGIPAPVLKGVALAQLAYGSLKTKHARDIDLLVPADQAEAALRLLERDGYTLSSPARHLNDSERRSLIRYGREAELVHRGRKLQLELHWRAADNALLLKGVDAHAATQDVTLSDDVRVRTLALDDLFAYLCVHGARHAWSRLKWLADVNALIASQTRGDADVEQFYRHAQKIGGGLCAGQTLLLCHDIFGLQLPAGLAAEIAANKRVVKLVAIARAAMTTLRTGGRADAGIASVMRFIYTQFLLGQGWRFYAAQYRVASVAPLDVIRLPLPPALHFLYPLLRLPLWLWRRGAVALGRRTGA
jgi:Uncharacterised nucleotidyltransferase